MAGKEEGEQVGLTGGQVEPLKEVADDEDMGELPPIPEEVDEVDEGELPVPPSVSAYGRLPNVEDKVRHILGDRAKNADSTRMAAYTKLYELGIESKQPISPNDKQASDNLANKITDVAKQFVAISAASGVTTGTKIKAKTLNDFGISENIGQLLNDKIAQLQNDQLNIEVTTAATNASDKQRQAAPNRHYQTFVASAQAASSEYATALDPKYKKNSAASLDQQSDVKRKELEKTDRQVQAEIRQEQQQRQQKPKQAPQAQITALQDAPAQKSPAENAAVRRENRPQLQRSGRVVVDKAISAESSALTKEAWQNAQNKASVSTREPVANTPAPADTTLRPRGGSSN